MRRADWQPRFRDVYADFDGVPFVWGETDCWQFGVAVVRAVTGAQLLPAPGSYAGRTGALRYLAAHGYETVAELASDQMRAICAPPIDPRAARVADIGITADDIVCVRAPGGWIARTADGTFTDATPVAAWAIGV